MIIYSSVQVFNAVTQSTEYQQSTLMLVWKD